MFLRFIFIFFTTKFFHFQTKFSNYNQVKFECVVLNIFVKLNFNFKLEIQIFRALGQISKNKSLFSTHMRRKRVMISTWQWSVDTFKARQGAKNHSIFSAELAQCAHMLRVLHIWRENAMKERALRTRTPVYSVSSW